MKNDENDTGITRGFVMVINSLGYRKKVTVSDYNQSKIDSYKYDINWDLSHGFTEAKSAFSEIEKGSRKHPADKIVR